MARTTKRQQQNDQASRIYPKDGLATIKEAMGFLKFKSRETIRQMILRGQLVKAELEHRVRITWESLHAVAKTRARQN